MDPEGSAAITPPSYPHTAGAGGRLAHDVIVYGAALGVAQGMSALALPFLARWMGPSGLGALELLTVAVSFAVSALGDAVSTATLAGWFAADSSRRPSVLITATALTAAVTGVAAVLAVAVIALVPGGMLERKALVATGLAIPLLALARIATDVFRLTDQPWRYMAGTAVRAIVGVGLGLVLVARGGGPAGFILGQAAGSACALLVAVKWGRSHFRGRVVVDEGRSIVRSAVGLVPLALAGWSMMLVDRWLLAAWTSLDEVGQYALANRVMSVLLLGVYAAGTAVTPAILRACATGDDGPLRARSLAQVVGAMAVLAGAVGVFAPEIVMVLGGREFGEASQSIPLLAVAALLFATVPVSQAPLLFGQRTRELATWAGVGALANIAMCAASIPRWGAQGAAAATVVGFGVQAVGYAVSAQRARPTSMPGPRIAAGAAAGAALCCLGAIDLGSPLRTVAAKAVLVLLVGLFVVRLGLLRAVPGRLHSL